MLKNIASSALLQAKETETNINVFKLFRKPSEIHKSLISKVKIYLLQCTGDKCILYTFNGSATN